MNVLSIVRRATGIGWQWKAFIPVIGVLFVSLSVMTVVVYRHNIPNKEWVILGAFSFGVVICFLLLAVLLVLVERPLEDLKRTIDRARRVRQAHRRHRPARAAVQPDGRAVGAQSF